MPELNILCGASIFAKEAIAESDIKFNYICDSDLSKSGKLFEGIRIIHYDEIVELSKKYEINLFLSNRYITETINKLKNYFDDENIKIYGFVSLDFKEIKEIKSISDYHDTCALIKNNIFINSYLIRTKEPLKGKILIYTMMKTGTISLRTALEKSLGELQYTLHSMQNISGFKQRPYANFIDLNNTSISLYHKKAVELTKKRLKEEKEVKIISLVREPVSRNISFMFFTLPILLGANAGLLNPKKEKYAYIEIFEDLYYQMINHDYFLNWFDIEIKQSLGIDIYKYAFDKEKGYLVIEEDNIKLLVLKLEKLNECTSVIKEFAGVDKFELEKENSSDNYWYKPIYDNFKKKFIPNEEHLQKLYESKFMKYFYTEKEIEAFYKKWRRNEK